MYRYAQERQDATDLASGRVLHGLPGQPALPVRLADEVFQRCLAARPAGARVDGLVLYDPCCGAGYHLTVLGLLHAARLARVIGSDVDERALSVAGQNLSLLDPAGLQDRANTLARWATHYGKESHRGAVESAERLHERLLHALGGRVLATEYFVADALHGSTALERLGPSSVDLVVTDVPYGLRSFWQSEAPHRHDDDPGWNLLETLSAVVAPGGVVGIVSDKGRKTRHERFRRVELFNIGKRRISIFVLEAAHQGIGGKSRLT